MIVRLPASILFQVVIDFRHGCITCNSGKFYLRRDACKLTCFYAASTLRRIHAMARYKTCKSRVTSPAGCRLTYLKFAVEITRAVIADYLKLQDFLWANTGIFACVYNHFCLRLACIFTCDSSIFVFKLHVFFCQQKQAVVHGNCGQICMSSACKFACEIPAIFG